MTTHHIVVSCCFLLLLASHTSGQDPTASGPIDYPSGNQGGGGGSVNGGTDGSEADPPVSDTGHNSNSNGYGVDSFCCDNNGDSGNLDPNPNSISGNNNQNSFNGAGSHFDVPLALLVSVGVAAVLSIIALLSDATTHS